MNIIEAITSRHSVRTFNGAALTQAHQTALAEAIRTATDPWGGDVTIRLAEFDLERGYRPSTYGMIRGARTFFLVAIGAGDASALSAGFRFQQIVLKAWQLGLGCCWIAATFKGSDFDRGQQWPAGETLKIVCPVGTPARPTLLNRLISTAFGSRNRKPTDRPVFPRRFQSACTCRQPLLRSSGNAAARAIVDQLATLAGARDRRYRPLLLQASEPVVGPRLRHRTVSLPRDRTVPWPRRPLHTPLPSSDTAVRLEIPHIVHLRPLNLTASDRRSIATRGPLNAESISDTDKKIKRSLSLSPFLLGFQ